MDHRVLVVLLWSSGLCAEDTFSSVLPGDVRLVGGASRCAGRLEMKLQGEWRSVEKQYFDYQLASAAEVCRRLNCGSVVSLQRAELPSDVSLFHDVFWHHNPIRIFRDLSFKLEITCSDSVRLVNGTSLCSGRLEVKSNQSNHMNQSWSPVCEDDFDQQDAEVVCRELDCGAPSVLQGALYGDVEAPAWTKEFQCGGRESALLDCASSARNTCSSGKAVDLTCSEPGGLRLVGGAGRCDGSLEMKQEREWKPVDERGWNLRLANVVCRELDCGSAVSSRRRRAPTAGEFWALRSNCDASSLMKCFTSRVYYAAFLEITCSDSVRLMNGTSLCSGRLEVKSDQSWSPVCEDDFDLQDAEVVCRELDCGPPSVFKGGLYGDKEAPLRTKEFQCGGHESALLNCDSSMSTRDTCSPVGLTCSDSDDVRLVGGANRCTGRLELKHHGVWKAVHNRDLAWDLKVTAQICRWLDCGLSVSTGQKLDSSEQSVWWIDSSCVLSESTLRECVTTIGMPGYSNLEITCSDSVRLVNRTGVCSGRLELRSNQSNQLWSSVCEADFDQQDAEVVCRELGCGAPLVLQGALYGDVEAPVWTDEFQCGGNETSLLDCRSSASTRNTCSPIGLTCSDPDNIRLVGEASRCAGTLEMKNQGEWRPVADWDSEWDHKSGAAVCRQLGCGSVVSTNIIEDLLHRSVWWIKSSCAQSASSLLECVLMVNTGTYTSHGVICSDLLAQPNISLSPSTDGVSNAKQQGLQMLMGYNFTITCSIEPQYPGGSFQVTFSTSNTAQAYTLPAVNHSAHFLFPAASPAHQGEYRCVYHLYVFSHNFSRESQTLYLTISASLTQFMIRLVVLLLGMMALITALYCNSKAIRNQQL